MDKDSRKSNKPRAGARWVGIADAVCRRLAFALAALLAALALAQTALQFDAVRALLSVTERLEGAPLAGIVFCIPLHTVV